MLIVCSSQTKCSKVGFLCLVLFYGRLNRFVRLCGFITFLWVNDVANCGRLGDSLGHREHIHMWFPRLLVYKIEFSNPCHALKNSVAVKELKISKTKTPGV